MVDSVFVATGEDGLREFCRDGLTTCVSAAEVIPPVNADEAKAITTEGANHGDIQRVRR